MLTTISFRLLFKCIRLSEIKTGVTWKYYDLNLDATRRTYRVGIQQLLHVRLVSSFFWFQNNPGHFLNTFPDEKFMRLTPARDIAKVVE